MAVSVTKGGLTNVSIDTRNAMEQRQPDRPSSHEICLKVKKAIKGVQDNRYDIVNPVINGQEATELGIDLSNAQEVEKILTEVLKCGPKIYVGKFPPEKAYEKEIEGKELYAFRWESQLSGTETYLKIAFINDDLRIVSLHPHRERKVHK